MQLLRFVRLASIPYSKSNLYEHRNFQKIDYAKLLNDDDDDEGSTGAGSVQALSSDEEFNTSIQKPVSANSSTSGGANMFDSLKEDSPVKKVVKRKLGPKAAEAKKPANRIKKRPVSDDSSDDDFTSRKVSYI